MDYFARLRSRIITDVLLMFLVTSQNELEDAQEQPKEFMNFALDTCEKQESKNVKTQAAQCLEAFAQKVDGCISFISMF